MHPLVYNESLESSLIHRVVPRTHNTLQPQYSFICVIATAVVPTAEQEQETNPSFK